MFADRAARIGAEATAARSFRQLFRDERHRPVEPDIEDVVAGFQTCVGLTVLNIRAEAADAGPDGFAVLGMLADFARERQQFERHVEIDRRRVGAFR